MTSSRKSEILPMLFGGCYLHAINSICAFSSACPWNIKGSPTFKWSSTVKSDLRNLTTSFILAWIHYELCQRVLMQLELLLLVLLPLRVTQEREALLKILNLYVYDWAVIMKIFWRRRIPLCSKLKARKQNLL